MSAKRTSWNEFSSSMASAVICLSTGRKFNFANYIFDIIVRNVDSSTKFYMYLRFLQLMIRAQERVFSGVETPLFEGMIVAHQADDVADEGAAGVDVDVVPAATDEPSIPSPTPITQPPPPLQELPSTSQEDIIANIDADEDVTLKDVAVIEETAKIEENADVQGRLQESQAQIYKIDLEHADKVLSMQDDELEPAELKKVVEVVTTAKLITEVVIAAATITAATTLITAATITTALSTARRRKGVVISDPEETATPSIIIHSEPKSKDKAKGIMVKEPKPLKKQAQIDTKKRERRQCCDEISSIEEEATNRSPSQKDMMIYLRYMGGFKMDYFKGMIFDDIRPIFDKYFNSNVAFLEKSKEQLEEEASRALKRASKSQAEKAAKKQKLDEEVDELKKHLQIVPNDEDDVYTKATPFARKSAHHNIYNYIDDLAGRE
nr:synaptobrevin, longin-like domain protein [Tanacetum cinerariifolium]